MLRSINGPTAAARAYGLDKKGHETVLVFDLGGGTGGRRRLLRCGGHLRLTDWPMKHRIFSYLAGYQVTRPGTGAMTRHPCGYAGREACTAEASAAERWGSRGHELGGSMS